jgi:hypothetical protein
MQGGWFEARSMTKPPPKYPELDALSDFIDRWGLTICVRPAHPSLEAVDGVVIAITTLDQPSIKLTVFDEYGDTRRGNPLLCLVLIGMEFGELDDAAGVEEWARVQCLDYSAKITQKTYVENMRSKSAFLQLYGPLPEVISDWDWQLNAGVARALRGMKG